MHRVLAKKLNRIYVIFQYFNKKCQKVQTKKFVCIGYAVKHAEYIFVHYTANETRYASLTENQNQFVVFLLQYVYRYLIQLAHLKQRNHVAALRILKTRYEGTYVTNCCVQLRHKFHKASSYSNDIERDRMNNNCLVG